MMFPIITNISDVLPHVEGREDFIVKSFPEGFTTIDYLFVGGKDTFENPYRRECRGIKFETSTGNILCRPFHKFFNLNEVSETKEEILPWKDNVIIMEKVDGSLIIPILLNGHVYFTTRHGITTIAQECLDWVSKNNPNGLMYIKEMILNGWTPLFEWCSPSNRVIIDYGSSPRFKFLVRRHIHSGIYSQFALQLDYFECARTEYFDLSFEHKTFIDYTKSLKKEEGYVLYFSDGTLVKIKADDYVMMHKVKSYFDFEKDVFSLIAQGKDDDLIPLLSQKQKEKFLEYKKIVSSLIISMNDTLNYTWYLRWKNNVQNKKDFALNYVNNHVDLPFRSIMFSMWDNPDQVMWYVMVNFLVKNSSTNSKFKELKKNLGIKDDLW